MATLIANKQQALQFFNSRTLFTTAHIGQKVNAIIIGNGTTIGVTDKDGMPVLSRSSNAQLQKTIYNVKANSQVAVDNPRNEEIRKAAMAAYKAGNVEEASKHMNDYLNKVQVSFSIVHEPAVRPDFVKGQLIEGVLTMITSEKGSLLTIENPVSPKAVAAGKSNASWDDEDDEETPSTETTPEDEAAKIMEL